MSREPGSESRQLPAGTVTFLLTDIEGSTRNWEASPRDMRIALSRHDELLSTAIAILGGVVLTERGEGDSFFAVFARASDAVAAADKIQLNLQEEPWPTGIPMKVRIAIHTGEAGHDYRGPEVNRCARLRSTGHGGQVLVSGTTAALTGDHLPDGAWLSDLGYHRLRDLARPEHIFQLCGAGLPVEFPPLASLDVARHNLPLQLTSFVGREEDLAEVSRLLRQHRIVTLVGSGGCGKTRLALQAAADLVSEYADGVWLADLAPLSDPGLVVQVVGRTMAVKEEPEQPFSETIADNLRSKELLILLDNCEHLIEACSELAGVLLKVAPAIHILVTSREPLRVPGEIVHRVPSLSLPPKSQSSVPQDLYQYESVQLFAERAVTSQPNFSLTLESAPVVARICERLDGVPLAIELAAARLRLMSPSEILERLEDRFMLLTDGSRIALERQQTLRAAVDWSHDLLSSAERILFRWLSVFAGPFDLHAVERVCGEPLPEGQVLALLGLLVDKSLVLADASPAGPVRYRLLETLRQYGSERLAEAGEEERARDAHLWYFMSLAEQAYLERSDRTAEWLVRLEGDHDNLRGAIDWSRRQDGDEQLRLAGALAWFWDYSHRTEGRECLKEALAHAEGKSPAMARALWGAHALAIWQGDTATALRLGEESVQMWRELGNREEVAPALWSLAWAHFLGGDDEGALPLWEESLKNSEKLGRPHLINRARLGICQFLVATGEVEVAESMAEAALAESLKLGDPWAICFAHHFMGDCSLIRGDFLASERRYGDSLRAGIAMGDFGLSSGQITGIAMAIAGQGRFLKALRLDEAADAAGQALGMDASGIRFWQALKTRYLGRAAKEVGIAAAKAARAEGRAMGFEAATDYALDFNLD